jgi:hypothetical protein
MPLTGRCQCGGAAYAIAGAPLEVYVWHCLECRRRSASAFGISVIVRVGDFSMLHGNLKRWTRAAERGGSLECTFYADCGSRLFHATPGEDLVSVRGGTLDAPPHLTGAVHIWTTRKITGVPIPADARQYAAELD